MNKTILYKEKTNYGTTHFYVVSEHKDAIARLTKKKTIDKDDAKMLVSLGFQFQKVNNNNLI
jgi:hypothetical protein